MATGIASSRFMYFQVTSDRRFNYTTVVWQVSPSLHGYVCNVDMIKLPQLATIYLQKLLWRVSKCWLMQVHEKVFTGANGKHSMGYLPATVHYIAIKQFLIVKLQCIHHSFIFMT